jgi:hypothetical protein
MKDSNLSNSLIECQTSTIVRYKGSYLELELITNSLKRMRYYKNKKGQFFSHNKPETPAKKKDSG